MGNKLSRICFRKSNITLYIYVYFFIQFIFQVASISYSQTFGSIINIISTYIFVIFVRYVSEVELKKDVISMLVNDCFSKVIKTFLLILFSALLFVSSLFFMYKFDLSIKDSLFLKIYWIMQCVFLSYFSYFFCGTDSNKTLIFWREGVLLIIKRTFLFLFIMFLLILFFQIYIVANCKYFTDLFINLNIPMSIAILLIHSSIKH